MAENLVDGEFWLPAQFLVDEEVFDVSFAPKDATLSLQGYSFGHHNQYSGVFSPRRKSSFLNVPSKNNNSTTSPDVGLHSQQSLSNQQIQIVQSQMLRQQQMAKQQKSVWGVQNNRGGVYQHRQNNQMVPNRGRNGVVSDGDRNIRPLSLSQSAWPPLQHATQQQHNQQYGSGMRAVFLGNPYGRRQRGGTGMFLPEYINLSDISYSL